MFGSHTAPSRSAEWTHGAPLHLARMVHQLCGSPALPSHISHIFPAHGKVEWKRWEEKSTRLIQDIRSDAKWPWSSWVFKNSAQLTCVWPFLAWMVCWKRMKKIYSMQFEEPAQRLLQGKSNIQCNKWDQVRSSEHDLVLYFLTYLDDLDLDSKPFVHGAHRDCFLTIPRKCAAWAMLIRLG